MTLLTKYPHLTARIFNTPLMVQPSRMEAIIAGISPRLFGLAPKANDQSHDDDDDGRPALPADVHTTLHEGRVALIHIHGALVHRSRFDLATCTGFLGYDQIRQALSAASADTRIRTIVLSIDSPGGEVAGAFELADYMHELRQNLQAQGRKLIAVADSLAASAAYLIASAADEIVLSESAYVGSVGVVAWHVDASKAMEAKGFKATPIFAGAHKVDGNPYQPLPDSVKADFQNDINSLYERFCSVVASYRAMPLQTVQRTEAQVFRGTAALSVGLADRVATLEDVLEGALQELSSPSTTTTTTHQQKEFSVSRKDSETTPATAAAAQAVQAERERTTAILALPEASTQTALAHECLALGLSLEQSKSVLSAAAKASPSPASASASFAAVMGAMGNPDASGIPTEDNDDAATKSASLAKEILQFVS